jgi:cytoskeletal protein CcmA (bactofilin family)
MAVLKREDEHVVTRSGGVDTVLGEGSEFEGKLTFQGQVRIDGKFNGQISTKDTLVIGNAAKVSAEISAGTVIVNGVVEGTIRATQLIELHQPARIKGTIESPALAMERGVLFEGTCKMESLGKPANAPPPLQAIAGGEKK